jgi:hypothetical protein
LFKIYLNLFINVFLLITYCIIYSFNSPHKFLAFGLQTLQTLCKRWEDVVGCRHEPACTSPHCLDRVYRQCQRLCAAIDVVYERGGGGNEERELALKADAADRRQLLARSWRADHEDSRMKVCIFIWFI